MTMQRTDERRAAPARSPTTLRSAEPMFVVDAGSRIVVWNERAAELFGFPADEALGRPCWEVVRGLTPEHRRYCAPECAVIRCGERGSAPAAYEMLCPTRDGQLRRLEVRMLLTEDDAGTGYVHMVRDVNDERQLIDYAREVLDRSAVALVLRDDHPVAGDTSPLSAREMEVLRLLDAGERPAEIAARLNISHRTARNHVQSIISKLGAHSAIEALAAARRERIL